MRQVIELRDRRQDAARLHPFFSWLRSPNVPLERRFDFAPAAALFIMQFRDMNLWALSYPEIRNEYEWVINKGTLEDRRHSRMFVDDWRALELDRRLGWRASDMLWWLFVSPEQEVIRHAGMRFLQFAVSDRQNPFIRFGHSEAGEATGNVFLSAAAPVAALLSETTGHEYRYFGPYHLGRESGHVANTEGLFEERVLDEQTRTAALQACTGMFDVFDDIFTNWLEYAKRYVETASVPVRPDITALPVGIPSPALDVSRCYEDPCTARAAWTLDARRARLGAHPLYSWLQARDSVSARDRLCELVPLWVMDIMGYRDLARYALTYPDPQSEAEHAISRWAAELSTHSALFLRDWESLGLDERLGFTASDTLEYVFLDPDLDTHREHLIGFAKMAMRYPDPAVRWWLMAALEATGEAFFACTRRLAETVEREDGVALDYLAERHCADPDASRGCPPAQLRADNVDDAVQLVNAVFDAMDSNLDRSYAAVRASLRSRKASG